VPFVDCLDYISTLLQLVSGKRPFYDVNDFQAANQVANGQRPKREKYPEIEQLVSPNEFWDLLGDCWLQEETQRPDMDDVVVRMKKINCQKLGRRDPAVVPDPMPRRRVDRISVVDAKGQETISVKDDPVGLSRSNRVTTYSRPVDTPEPSLPEELSENGKTNT
jgi:hypothetical protein